MQRHIPPAGWNGAEWLVTNGLGGFASGTLAGPPIRRWHGLLVAALPAPLGRVLLLNHLEEAVADCGTPLELVPDDFHLDHGLPVWTFTAGGRRIERRLVMGHGVNATLIHWRVVAGPALTLTLEPWFNPRPVSVPVDQALADDRAVHLAGDAVGVRLGRLPEATLRLTGGTFQAAEAEQQRHYSNEAEGEDPADGRLWRPGRLTAALDGAGTTLAVTVDGASVAGFEAAWSGEIERRRVLVAAAHPALQAGVAAELVIAADAFVVEPQDRPVEPGARTVIAGYHWFGDWGRDTMISLEGLCLLTGRAEDARRILMTFAGFVRDGLIPNMFPDGAGEGLYHTVDATLWFFHALDRYATLTGDWATVARLLPVMEDIAARHRAGTRFGIKVDPADGLLRQGEPGWQLTWMDAKVGDWVVTPRHGKAVEINALWYNALGALSDWNRRLGRAEPAERLAAEARRVKDAFNRRFWSGERGHLFDVVDGPDGDDPCLRPNQLFALSLPRPVLDSGRWAPVVDQVTRHLLTPFGLRSLASDHPAYRPIYFGNQWSRDGAYHQGTVWAWLVGALTAAWSRAHPEDMAAMRKVLDVMSADLNRYGIGTLGEIFDGDPPHSPRGCIAQAWSVAEWLRSRVLCAQGGGVN